MLTGESGAPEMPESGEVDDGDETETMRARCGGRDYIAGQVGRREVEKAVPCARAGRRWLNQPPEGGKKRGDELGFQRCGSGERRAQEPERERREREEMQMS